MVSLNEKDVIEIGRNVFHKNEVKIIDFKVAPKSSTSLGYLGNHMILTANFFLDGQTNKKTFFVKTHTITSTEDFLEKTGIFQKEINFYNILVKDFEKFVGKVSWCPKFYFSKRGVLVLEDLSEAGYLMVPESLTLDENHVKIGLKTLARMHAFSILLEKKKDISLTTAYSDLFREILYDENQTDAPSRKWISWQVQDLLVGIDLLNRYSHQQKSLIKQKFPQEIMRIYLLSKQSNKYKNLLTHGDVWKNNILFKYKENIPVHCKLVDFQFIRYAPPAHDVMHFLHYTTKKCVRDKRKIDFLKFYYENFIQELQTNCESIEIVITWNELLESCNEFKELALIQCLLSLHYILGPVTLNFSAENYQKYENYLSEHRNEYMRIFFEKESYKEKIVELMCELIDNYII